MMMMVVRSGFTKDVREQQLQFLNMKKCGTALVLNFKNSYKIKHQCDTTCTFNSHALLY